MKLVAIYESELRAIAAETSRWDSETGGDLFGYWGQSPTVLLATRLGPNSVRGAHKCQFDLEHLESMSARLAIDWKLSYFGDWHSHGLSTLRYPSQTDRNRIGKVIERNRFSKLLEFITTRTAATNERDEGFTIQGFEFPQTTWSTPEFVEINVLPFTSPLRQVFRFRGIDELLVGDPIEHDAPLNATEGVSIAEGGMTQLKNDRELVARRGISHLVRELENEYQEVVVDRQFEDFREFSVCFNSREICLRCDTQWPFHLQSILIKGTDGRCIEQHFPSGISALAPKHIIDCCQHVVGPTVHSDSF